MKKLKDIRLYVSSNAKTKYGAEAGITLIYSHYISNKVIASFNYLNIFITDMIEEDKRICEGNFFDYYCYLDLAAYKAMPDNYDKKKFFLDFFHRTLLKLCDMFDWEKAPFEVAYQKCFEKNLVCDWFFKRKLFKSPDKQHYFGLYHIIEFEGYEVYEILYDKNKKELARRKCFHDFGGTFSVSWASWEGKNDEFYYRFSVISKTFTAKITDLLEGKQYDLPIPMNTSKFFKK